MQRLEFSGAVRPIYGSLGVKRLTTHTVEIIGDHQCGFRHNQSDTYHIFWICQILKKKWEYNEAVQQLFIDFKKAYDSVTREVSYKIIIGFGIPMKLVKLIKVCLNETYRIIRAGKHLSDTLRVKNGLKQGNVLSPLLFDFA